MKKCCILMVICAVILAVFSPALPAQAAASPLTLKMIDGQVWLTDCDKSASGEVIVPSQVTVISDLAFYQCGEVTRVVLPQGITTIGVSAFEGCRNLTELVIPDTVTTIGDRAFMNNAKLTHLYIPASVTSIGDIAFDSCKSLMLQVDPNNPNYSADERGVLFNKDKTCLISTTDSLVGPYTIPDSVTTIGRLAFYDNGYVTQITIPSSVEHIESQAFQGNNVLSEVIYCGTQAQWDALDIVRNNASLWEAKLHLHGTEDHVCPLCGYEAPKPEPTAFPWWIIPVAIATFAVLVAIMIVPILIAKKKYPI